MFLRLDEARQLGAQVVRDSILRKTADSLLQEKAHFSILDTFDIFLSHSFSDAQIILGVTRYLETQGKSVYVDWINDKGLDRNRVTAETADLLRQRMKASKSLVYATSDNSPNSKWMPWELGFSDEHKPGMVPILPLVVISDSEWKGQEYVGLYPVIDRLQLSGALQSFVVKQDFSAMPLSQFGNYSSYSWKNNMGARSSVLPE